MTGLETEGSDPLTNLFHRGVKKSRPCFDHEFFDAELGRQALRLKSLFRGVRGKHLFHESAVALADFNRRIAFVADHRSPRNTRGLESNRLPRGYTSHHSQ